jgi:hypothetical protein
MSAVEFNSGAYLYRVIDSTTYAIDSADLPSGNYVVVIGLNLSHTFPTGDITLNTIPSTVTDNGSTYNVIAIAFDNSRREGSSLSTEDKDTLKALQTRVKSATIPSNILFVNSNPFDGSRSNGVQDGLTQITSLTFEHADTKLILWYNCFFFYTTLISVIFNKVNSVTREIGMTGSAFSDCHNLTNIEIPILAATTDPNTPYDGSGMLTNCFELTSLTIPPSMTAIPSSLCYMELLLTGSEGNWVRTLRSKLANITFHSNITSIGAAAFQGTAISELTIHSSVTSISVLAFNHTPNLAHVIFEHTSAASLVSVFPTDDLISRVFHHSLGFNNNNDYVSADKIPLATVQNREMRLDTTLSAILNLYFTTVADLGPIYIHQNFYLTEEFDVSANNITAAVFDAEDTTDVSGNYPNKAEIRVEKSVIQNMFQYWTDAIDMSNAVVSDIFYRVNYTDSAVPLSPDFVVGAIMTASDPNMNPDSNLTNYLPQDYLRYLAKKLFNTTRGVDLFANETEVLQSVNTRCRVGLNQILLTYLDANANGIIRDEDDFIILDPYDPVEVAGSQKVTGNPSKKIMKQILSNDPARFLDISSNYAVAGQTYWYKMPIEVGDNLYFPVTIKAPTDQQKLTQPDSTTLIEDRTYLIRCVVVADGSIPSPYNVYSYSALPSLTTFYH